MNTETLIDAWLREYDYATTGSDVTTVRAKGLDKAQEASDEFWLEFDGADFQQASTTVTLAASTNSIAMPSDFYKVSSKGKVKLRVSTTDRRDLIYLPPNELLSLQEENGTTPGMPAYYGIWAMDGTTDLIPELHVDILADVQYTIAVHYVKNAPILADTTDVASQLHYWPVMYHTILLKGLLARGARIMGDTVRQAQFEAEFQRAKALAIAKRKHGQDEDERIGRAGYAAWQNW